MTHLAEVGKTCGKLSTITEAKLAAGWSVTSLQIVGLPAC